jgi:hypothetical protein
VQTDIALIGDTLVSHPVLDALGLRTFVSAPKGDSATLDKAGLVIYDCRREDTAELSNPDSQISHIVLSGKPVLLLSPTANDQRSLAKLVGGAFEHACIATVVACHADSPVPAAEHFMLPHPSNPQGTGSFGSSTGEEIAPQRQKPAHLLRAIANGIAKDPAMEHFIERVRQYAEKRRGLRAPMDMPSGLKYITQTFSATAGVQYNDHWNGWDESNGVGALTTSWTAWAFLDQPNGGSPGQYLVIESTHNLNAGSLFDDDSQGRGFMNLYLTADQLPDDASLKFQNQAPGNSENSWSQTVDLSINYRSPLGNYDIYKYSHTVADSIDSWSVRALTSQSKISSQWYVNSPVNGSDIDNSASDAFDWRDNVKSFPYGARVGIGPSAISAWSTNGSLLTGSQRIVANTQCRGAWFDSKECFLGICSGYVWVTSLPYGYGFPMLIDFTSLQP